MTYPFTPPESWQSPRWMPLDDPAELADYLEGHMAPLQSRETEHGVEVWMPHTFLAPSRFTGTRVCQVCGLLPLDYDKIETDCLPTLNLDTYTLHYVSADGPTDADTWSVYREQYESATDEVPIDGTQQYVSTHPTEAEAYAEANRLQASYAETKAEQDTRA